MKNQVEYLKGEIRELFKSKCVFYSRQLIKENIKDDDLRIKFAIACNEAEKGIGRLILEIVPLKDVHEFLDLRPSIVDILRKINDLERVAETIPVNKDIKLIKEIKFLETYTRSAKTRLKSIFRLITKLNKETVSFPDIQSMGNEEFNRFIKDIEK